MEFISRFTERAQRALLSAQKEAAAMHRSAVGTEHLLLGVLRDPGPVGSVFKELSIDEVRRTVLSMVGEGEESGAVRSMTYLPRTKKVLEQSAKEARDLGQSYVGTEHLLLALMREREGVAAQALLRMGVNLNQAREDLLRACGSGAQPGGENRDPHDRPVRPRPQSGRAKRRARSGHRPREGNRTHHPDPLQAAQEQSGAAGRGGRGQVGHR